MNASELTSPDSIEVATDHRPVFITARELRARQDSAVLDAADVWRAWL